MRVFAFLDIDFFPVTWAVTRGMVVSSDRVMQEPKSPFISFMLSGIIKYQNNARLHNELLIDKVRSSLAPSHTSRLQGMYFFASKEDALDRVNDPDWPDYFQIENLVEFKLYPSAPIRRVDANWITYAPLSSTGRLEEDSADWIAKYWKGVPYSDSPVWELICKGVALIVDEQIRRKCYSSILEHSPELETLLLMSRLASEAGSFGGLVTPAVLKRNNNNFRLSYLMEDKSFHDKDIILKMSQHPDAGRLGALMRENESFKTPDFREHGCNFTLTSKETAFLETALFSVHHS